MKVKILSFALFGVIVTAGCFGDDVTYMPPSGYVPDETTAITIAKAVWIPIYGKDRIESQAPFVATLVNGAWYIRGTLPEGYLGGTAEAVISKRDGQILRVIHGK